MEDFSESPNKGNELESLEGGTTVVEPATVTSGDPKPGADGSRPTPPNKEKEPKEPKKSRIGGRLRRIFAGTNVYVLLLVFIVLLAGIIGAVAYLHGRQNNSNTAITSQNLSQNALNQLSSSDETVGDAKQTLNVESNAVFAGQVLVRSNLEVAGTLQIGSSLQLAGITATGTSTFDELQVSKDLSVSGNIALQGQLTVQKSIDVNGGGTFNGTVSAPEITTGNLQLTGDLDLTHHITAGGVTPSRSAGSALGSGGTASVSGSDTAGSVSLNSDSSPSSGCMVTVTFQTKFNATPHVIVTPIGSAAGGLAYYVNRSTSSFSICTNSAPPASATFGYDYMVID